ncbi:hypothetical protein GGS20DRAFT_544774 [Poronia punctata]|nr:hypothetical protein GGS20DRAFT_544774 [Poronia punctata]
MSLNVYVPRPANGNTPLPTRTAMAIFWDACLDKQAWVEEPNKKALTTSWNRYIAQNNYQCLFEPLRGTERDRYMPIIMESERRENKRHKYARSVFDSLLEIEPKVRDLHDGHYAPLGPVHGGGNQNSMFPPPEEFDDDRAEIARGLDKLDVLFRQLQKEGSRHTKRSQIEGKSLHGQFNTRYGMLDAVFVLTPEPWYMAHRPGDPIVRIKLLDTDELFRVSGLAGANDEDEETHDIICEAVVPFLPVELYKRFTRSAYTRFLQIVVAALRFNPRDPDHKPLASMKDLENICTSEFGDTTDEEKASHLMYLAKIWLAKFGIDKTRYPKFLQDQIATSISFFREMGWLMSKLQSAKPKITRVAYWVHCQRLLRDVTGRPDVRLLAQEYFDITLAAETMEKLDDGDTDDIFVYWQSMQGREQVKVCAGQSCLSLLCQLHSSVIPSHLCLSPPSFSLLLVGSLSHQRQSQYLYASSTTHCCPTH